MLCIAGIALPTPLEMKVVFFLPLLAWGWIAFRYFIRSVNLEIFRIETSVIGYLGIMLAGSVIAAFASFLVIPIWILIDLRHVLNAPTP